jgi:hypothetical protein
LLDKYFTRFFFHLLAIYSQFTDSVNQPLHPVNAAEAGDIKASGQVWVRVST